MSIIGKTLGNFQCTELLGKGGMGEVYQAKDQKLGRDVAIKVLPEEFAKDADRVARFQREAKLLASLNHPNIASIYGLEESGGTHFLVLELIEGDTLADRIKGGPIPIEESLKPALQIAEALEAAHEKGVIHRDLKPANIKVTPDGKVKVLDFGLAKAFAGDSEDMNLSNSPTLSEAATMQGVILGTAAYMPPEQAKGKTVDKRADIWAFGVVLFEMLTGRQLFMGETVSETLAAVLMREPDWKRLPPILHPRIRLLLERCLKKEPKDRYSGISDARVDIQEVLADPSGVFARPLTTMEPQKKLRTILPWASATLILGLIIATIAVWKLKPPEPGKVMRSAYELPDGQQLNIPSGNIPIPLAVSPDGSRFVYGTSEGLFLRSMDELEARLLTGTDKSSLGPFFSPDGQWIGYFSLTEAKLQKVAISGGAPVTICETSPLIVAASWSSDNTILYSDIAKGVMRVSADGGTPDVLVKGSLSDIANEGFPGVPQMLPDGKTLLFTNLMSSDQSNWQVGIQSLKSGERKILIRSGFGAAYCPTGHLVYSLASNNIMDLLAVPFDLGSLDVKGGSVPMLEGIMAAAISYSGTLLYIPQPGTSPTDTRESTAETPASGGRTLVWVDRQGKEEQLGADPNAYNSFSISPDATRVAVTVGKGSNDIWIWDITRKTMTRLTFDEAGANYPLWTPDSKRILYFSGGGGALGSICWKAADGTGGVTKLGSAPDEAFIPSSWSKDGKTLALLEFTLVPIGFDIGMMSMEGEHARKPLLQGKYNELNPKISPDGRWMAYSSNESGKHEVYVRPFPDVESGGRWQISTSGGDSPLWSPDGHELFYRQGDSFMSVAVETEPTFKPGNPKVLFKGTYLSINSPPLEGTFWHIHPNGKKFLMIKPPAALKSTTGEAATPAPQPKIIIVTNWLEELKQRVPVE